MCELISWKEKNGKLMYNDDDSCQRIIDKNNSINWYDLVGHSYIVGNGEKYQYPINANTKELPLEIHNALRAGKFDRVMRETNQKLTVLGRHKYLYQSWYDNGQLEKEYTYKNGKIDGKFQRWYSNGQLEVECTYKDGKFDGKYKSWHNNGQLLF